MLGVTLMFYSLVEILLPGIWINRLLLCQTPNLYFSFFVLGSLTVVKNYCFTCKNIVLLRNLRSYSDLKIKGTALSWVSAVLVLWEYSAVTNSQQTTSTILVYLCDRSKVISTRGVSSNYQQRLLEVKLLRWSTGYCCCYISLLGEFRFVILLFIFSIPFSVHV